jgi:hypothetical protein
MLTAWTEVTDRMLISSARHLRLILAGYARQTYDRVLEPHRPPGR